MFGVVWELEVEDYIGGMSCGFGYIVRRTLGLRMLLFAYGFAVFGVIFCIRY